jgi:hypothetical protein
MYGLHSQVSLTGSVATSVVRVFPVGAALLKVSLLGPALDAGAKLCCNQLDWHTCI